MSIKGGTERNVLSKTESTGAKEDESLLTAYLANLKTAIQVNLRYKTSENLHKTGPIVCYNPELTAAQRDLVLLGELS